MRSRRAHLFAGLLVLSLAQTGCLKLVASALSLATPVPRAVHRVTVTRNMMVAMPDGVRLATDLYRPADLAQAPTILFRTPYGKEAGLNPKNYRALAGQGYVVAAQDTRGRFKSEGEFYPFVHEAEDGRATVAWITRQPWWNGRLGTAGGSYLGIVQYAMAPGSPEITALMTPLSGAELGPLFQRGGVPSYLTMYFWTATTGDHHPPELSLGRIRKEISGLPISENDQRLGLPDAFYRDVLSPERLAKLLDQLDYQDQYQKVQAPALIVAGWYDLFTESAIQTWQKLRTEGRGAARESRLVIGPWAHTPRVLWARKFGPEGKMPPEVIEALPWFDHWLRGVDNEVADWPPIRYFLMGANEWRQASAWPLPGTVFTEYYFHSSGQANSCAGDGALSRERPDEEATDQFVYDPAHPVPTLGGGNLEWQLTQTWVIPNAGVFDQRKIERRRDLLCYTSAPLSEDLEVTGPIQVVVYAASSAQDTDFTAKLVEVLPQGKALNLQDGIIRARFRSGDLRRPELIEPDRIYAYTIDLSATANLFRRGSRLRVEISSSNFPRFARNLNTGEDPATATRMEKAEQTLYHDSARPSRIVLPIVPRP